MGRSDRKTESWRSRCRDSTAGSISWETVPDKNLGNRIEIRQIRPFLVMTTSAFANTRSKCERFLLNYIQSAEEQLQDIPLLMGKFAGLPNRINKQTFQLPDPPSMQRLLAIVASGKIEGAFESIPPIAPAAKSDILLEVYENRVARPPGSRPVNCMSPSSASSWSSCAGGRSRKRRDPGSQATLALWTWTTH